MERSKEKRRRRQKIYCKVNRERKSSVIALRRELRGIIDRHLKNNEEQLVTTALDDGAKEISYPGSPRGASRWGGANKEDVLEM